MVWKTVEEYFQAEQTKHRRITGKGDILIKSFIARERKNIQVKRLKEYNRGKWNQLLKNIFKIINRVWEI